MSTIEVSLPELKEMIRRGDVSNYEYRSQTMSTKVNGRRSRYEETVLIGQDRNGKVYRSQVQSRELGRNIGNAGSQQAALPTAAFQGHGTGSRPTL